MQVDALNFCNFTSILFLRIMQNELLSKLFDIADKFKIPLLLALVGILLIGAGLLLPKLSREKKQDIVVENASSNSSTSEKQSTNLKVDIAGAVLTPGVYELSSEKRLEDAIKLAGGFSTTADAEWVAKNINLASKLVDGQKIYIQAKGETQVSGTALGAKTSDKINVNFASAKELDTLPGIGEVTAAKIIAARPYNSVEELLTKKAVGKATFEKIKDLVSVN